MKRKTARPSLEALEDRFCPAGYQVDFNAACVMQDGYPTMIALNTAHVSASSRDGHVFGRNYTIPWNGGDSQKAVDFTIQVVGDMRDEGWSVDVDNSVDVNEAWFQVNGHEVVIGGAISPAAHTTMWISGIKEAFQPKVDFVADVSDSTRAVLNLAPIHPAGTPGTQTLTGAATLHILIGTTDVQVSMTSGWNASQCLAAIYSAMGAAGRNPTTGADGAVSFDAGTSHMSLYWTSSDTATTGGLYADLAH